MRVLHLIDSLELGGAEKIAVSLVNALNENGIEAYICATRKEGALVSSILVGEKYMYLRRKSTFDIGAFMRLRKYIVNRRITLIHAHGPSYFLASVIRIFTPGCKFIWHDHNGLRPLAGTGKNLLVRLFSFLFDGVVVANGAILEWSRNNLFVRKHRIVLLPNFSSLSIDMADLWTHKRLSNCEILCVANFRAPKDHMTLLKAFDMLARVRPEAVLVLVGKEFHDDYSSVIRRFIADNDIKGVSIAGVQDDIRPFLKNASIGVISSTSEGLPIALLEYGMAGLPVVSSDVGDCAKVLGYGEFGWITPVGDAKSLFAVLHDILDARSDVGKKAKALHDHVAREYSTRGAVKILNEHYGAT